MCTVDFIIVILIWCNRIMELMSQKVLLWARKTPESETLIRYMKYDINIIDIHLPDDNKYKERIPRGYDKNLPHPNLESRRSWNISSPPPSKCGIHCPKKQHADKIDLFKHRLHFTRFYITRWVIGYHNHPSQIHEHSVYANEYFSFVTDVCVRSSFSWQVCEMLIDPYSRDF